MMGRGGVLSFQAFACQQIICWKGKNKNPPLPPSSPVVPTVKTYPLHIKDSLALTKGPGAVTTAIFDVEEVIRLYVALRATVGYNMAFLGLGSKIPDLSFSQSSTGN